MQSNLFHYKAIITSVYDGDTCTVDIDLGFSVWVRGEKLRLLRINAPEVTGASKVRGLKSKKFHSQGKISLTSAQCISFH